MVGLTNTFSEEDDARLIHAREELKMKWKDVAVYMERPLNTCQWRYAQRLRPKKEELVMDEAPSIAPSYPKRVPLHQQLGIKTKVVEIASYDRYQTRIMKITLPAV